jgi:hypothetical protein
MYDVNRIRIWIRVVVLQMLRIWIMVRVMVGFFLKTLVSSCWNNFNSRIIYGLQSCEQTREAKSVKEKQTSGEKSRVKNPRENYS